MLSNVPSLPQILPLLCPVRGQILTQFVRDEEHLYCLECGFTLGDSRAKRQRPSEWPQMRDASEYE